MPTVLFLCSGNYYRSRFAELLFNHLAGRFGLPWRADSAGLVPGCHLRNVGTISPHALAGLAARGIAVPEAHRAQRDAVLADFAAAGVVVAVKEAEHRPVMDQRFPSWAGRIRYWHIHDVQDAEPAVALPQLEHDVRDLIAELRGPKETA